MVLTTVANDNLLHQEKKKVLLRFIFATNAGDQGRLKGHIEIPNQRSTSVLFLFFTNSELKFLYKALGWKTNMAQWQTGMIKGQYVPVGLQMRAPCTTGQSPLSVQSRR